MVTERKKSLGENPGATSDCSLPNRKVLSEIMRPTFQKKRETIRDRERERERLKERD